MTDAPKEMIGGLVQTYARLRWDGESHEGAAARMNQHLDKSLCDRVEVLGVDMQRLLTVKAAEVLTELRLLEDEATLEDAGVRPTAGDIGGRHKDRSHDQTKVQRRNGRVRPWKHR